MSAPHFKINPVTALAYNMADGSRKYVLFLGAGVSRDAGIPTGYEILIETLRRIRRIEEKNDRIYTMAEMEEYYHAKAANASYSEIVSALLRSNEEQRQYLQSFFGGVPPGAAHREIAAMVRKGLVRFIITTNFDTLLEQALDNEGLKGRYTVITETDVKTSRPWTQEETCRIYKIHGTIEKGRIRNTRRDLSRLSRDLTDDVATMLEHHGVIVLGYSAQQDDQAVLNLFNSRKFRGYSLYWTSYRGELTDNARYIINKQDAVIIHVESAAAFLQDLSDRMEMARSEADSASSGTARLRFRGMVQNPSASVEIQQTADEEAAKVVAYLRHRAAHAAEGREWETAKEALSRSANFILLAEQVIKYRDEQAPRMFSLLQKIDEADTSGAANFLCYILLLTLGALIMENGKYALFSELWAVRRLNARRDAMENLLQWPTEQEFVRQHFEKKNTHPLFPYFDAMLELCSGRDFPLTFDFRRRVAEADLLFFVATVKHQLSVQKPYWRPCSCVYCDGALPDFFLRLRLDRDFRAHAAKGIFSCDGPALLALLDRADEVYQAEMSGYLTSVPGCLPRLSLSK